MLKQTNWLIRFFKGVIIALGFIIPGASGSLLAAILGVYEKLLSFLANVKKDFKENFFFFLPIGIGGLIGIGILSIPIEFLLSRYQIVILWFFAGVITGTIPALLKTSTKKRRRTKSDLIIAFLSVFISFMLLYSMSMITLTIDANFIGFVIAGIIIAIGVLIPGLSPTNILLILGIYYPMLTGFRNFDITSVFIPIIVGGLIGVVLLSKIMDNLIKKHHTKMYHVIIGLVISSTILIILPPVADYNDINSLNIVMSILMFIIGILLGILLSKLEQKHKES